VLIVSSIATTARFGWQRFGLGARAGQARLGSLTPDALAADVDTASADPLLAGDMPPSHELLRQTTALLPQEAREAFRERQRAAAADRDASGMSATGTRPQAGENRSGQPRPAQLDIYRAEVEARFRAAANARIGFRERLVWFWSNHFAVSTARGAVMRAGVGAYEREAIRRHVAGRFVDMLSAVVKHPVMLHYLDAHQSIGPNSAAGQRRGRGLNENLAREILELHTLGADGGYTQADIGELARILTGWGYGANPRDPETVGRGQFNANRHEPGARTLLGQKIADGGAEQLDAAIAILAAHPATARHVARKLAVHFVADRPPMSLVGRLERTFRDTQGDLKMLARALVDAPESWSSATTKIRTPFEWTTAMLRAGIPVAPAQIIVSHRRLGQDIWGPPAPDGYSDATADLLTPAAMKVRFEIAAAWSQRLPDRFEPGDLAATLLGPDASTDTVQAIRRAESPEQAAAILFLSPEFLRR
jgi:uncharacterized protein (DUF1800 family)